LGGGGGGGGGQQQPQGIQRATGILSNPVNFKQYAQITGVGPIVGTVRIYNQFGLLAMQSQQGGGFGGGLVGGGFGGFGGGGFGGGGGGQNQLPGMGVTGQGDDPPQGVLLHVNYANMFLPNQQQINQGGGNGFGGGNNVNLGGLGGIGGKGFGGGFGGFGNGGHGL
ncbi:MAG: hypothetical protein JNM56_18605, partial [Planctomycetia bacterium]|nr:hypothetical protein [Planctomycetia bacterium]